MFTMSRIYLMKHVALFIRKQSCLPYISPNLQVQNTPAPRPDIIHRIKRTESKSRPAETPKLKEVGPNSNYSNGLMI